MGNSYTNQQIRAMAARDAVEIYSGQGINFHDGVKELTDDIAKYIAEGDTPYQPNLGCATTKLLLEEVATRLELTQNSTAGRDLADMCRQAIDNLDSGILNYRTVDS